MAEFSEQPNYVYSEMVGFSTKIIPFSSGKEARYAKGRSHREFTLVYNMADDTQRDTILAFYTARIGNTNTFTWTNTTDSTTYTVRFKDNSLSVETFDFGVHRIQVSLIEVV